MSGALASSLYDSLQSGGTWLPVGDLIFSKTLTISTNPAISGQFVLLNSQQLDLNVQPGAVSAFLVLRQITLTNLQEPRKLQGNHESLSQSVVVTVPIGGGSQTFQLSNSNFLTAIGFQSFSAAIATLSVGDVQIDRNDGNFQEVFLPAGNIGGVGVETLLSLTQQFGPYGFEGFKHGFGGLRAKLSINNTSGVAQSFTLFLLGSQFALDAAKWDVVYNDIHGVPIPIAFGILLLPGISIPLNQLIQVPINDPHQPNFGSLTFFPTVFDTFYDQFVSVDVVLTASILYFIPAGAIPT